MGKRLICLKVLHQEELADRLFHTTFSCEDEAALEVQPGQFLMLRCEPDNPYKIMRPMSILRASRQQGTVEILFRVVGEQTEKLSNLPEGTSLPALLPLGKGFGIPESDEEAVCVAGGTGIPPILLLAERLKVLGHSPAKIFFGARTSAELIRPFLSRWDASFSFSTEDGSFGYKGTVTELFKRALPAFENARFYACGPRGMLLALKQVLPLELHQRCEISVEEVMACGIGACYGCALEYDALGMDKMKLVCRDGPVFNLAKVFLD